MTLVSIFVLAPLVVMLSVQSRSDGSADLVQLSRVVTHALVLVSAVFVYFHWRAGSEGGDRRLTGWLVVGLVMYATQGLVQSGFLDAHSDAGVDSWPLLTQLGTTWLLVVLTHLSAHVEVRHDPAVTAAAGGALLSVAYVAAVELAPLHLSQPAPTLLNAFVLLGGLVFASLVVTRADVPRSMRYYLGVAGIALTGSEYVGNLRGAHRLLDNVSVLTSVLGAIALCSLTQRLLHRTVLRQQSEVQTLLAALADVHADVRHDRELLHEMTATIAGITTASEVILSGLADHAGSRERVESMLKSELARLGRLTGDRADTRRTDHVALDEVVEPIVIGHWLRGHDVRWSRSHVRAEARSDDVAEVVSILLENAYRHAPGATVTLTVGLVDGQVEITCSDDGPGVDAAVADRIFDSGVRGPDSPGQGLGLAMARRVVEESGGSLELAPSGSSGARFVARFPEHEGVVGRRDHVA